MTFHWRGSFPDDELVPREPTMSQAPSNEAVRIPRWLIWVGTAAIVLHLGAVGVNTLAAPSGPWADNDGTVIRPPLLPALLSETVFGNYLKSLRLDKNYHVLANHPPASTAVWLEFQLKDDEGRALESIRVPDDEASCWVRHRQSILTVPFASDEPLPMPQGEVIAAPGQDVPKVQFWDMQKGQLKLITIDKNQIPRDHPVLRPSDFSIILARSYARYLCRTHGAARLELLRHHQDRIRPYVLNEPVPTGAFTEIVSEYGEFSK
jgi:hypothetical protein